MSAMQIVSKPTREERDAEFALVQYLGEVLYLQTLNYLMSQCR